VCFVDVVLSGVLGVLVVLGVWCGFGVGVVWCEEEGEAVVEVLEGGALGGDVEDFEFLVWWVLCGPEDEGGG